MGGSYWIWNYVFGIDTEVEGNKCRDRKIAHVHAL